MSKNGTPFKGAFPKGNGGCCGTYNGSIVFNVGRDRVLADQYQYIKPSVLSTKGMLEKKYRWIHGQYPNYWVQPVGGSGNLSDNYSQLEYIHKKAAANDCVSDINTEKYDGYIIHGGPLGCNTSAAKYVYKIIESNKGYTKFLNNPMDSSQRTLKIQRKCANPLGKLKPFPFATNGGSNSSKHDGPPIPVQIINYLTPPDWYWK
jgi:hypothetical protein